MTAPILRGSTAPLAGTPAGQGTLANTSPASTQVGDLVLVVTWQGLNSATQSSLTIVSGYTQLVNFLHDDGTADGALGIAWIIATQAGAQTYQAFTSSSQNTDARTAIRVFQVDTFNTSGIVAATPVSFTDGALAPDAPNVSGLDSTRDYWIEAIGGWWCNSGSIDAIPGAPTNHTNLISTSAVGWLELALASRTQSGITAYDPAIFTDNLDATTNRGSVGCTVAILGTAPSRGIVGWEELEVAEGVLRRGISGWIELEVESGPDIRGGTLGWIELQAPDYNFPGQMSFLFHKSWARYRYEAGNPVPLATRRGLVGWKELEVPVVERRANVSWEQLEVPGDAGLAVGVRNSGPPQSWEASYISIMGNRTPDVYAEFAYSNTAVYPSFSGIENPNFTNNAGNLDEYQTWFSTRPTKRMDLALAMCPWKTSTGNQGAGLEVIANGSENARFATCAVALQNLGLAGSASRPIYIRLGWEMGSPGFPWGTTNDGFTPNTTWINWYKQAWAQIVTTMRDTVPQNNWKFAWCPINWNWSTAANSAFGLPWINSIYPGNDYVDLIGMDHYDSPGGAGGYSSPPTAQEKINVWNNFHLANLTNMDTFAESKGKPQMFGEWGIWHSVGGSTVRGGDDNPHFIEQTYNWTTSHNFEYIVYFNRILSTVEHSLSVDGTMSKANSRNMYNDTFSLLPHPF